jgi:hypothetical protein
MGEYEKTICELFDNCPNGQQIRAIAGMYHIDVEEVKDILVRNGRELPKGGKPKATIKASATQEEMPKEMHPKQKSVANIPDAVKNLVFLRIDELDGKLGDLNDRIRALEDAKAAVVSEYKILADFISVPFGAGNLSHKGSDNTVESPQANA